MRSKYCSVEKGKAIPPGYACIKSTDVSAHKEWNSDGYLIPRWIQEDLFGEIRDYTDEYGKNYSCIHTYNIVYEKCFKVTVPVNFQQFYSFFTSYVLLCSI